MAIDDRFDPRAVLAASGLDDQTVRFAREERVAHDRILDQVQEIGGIAPQLREAGRPDLRAKLPPRRAATRPVDGRIAGAQRGRDGGAYRLVDEQTVSVVLDERQRRQSLEAFVTGAGRQHRPQQGARCPADDRGGVQRLERLRIVDVGEVAAHELLDDAMRSDFFDVRCRRALEGLSGELQGQRMASRESVDASGVRFRDADATQQLAGFRLVQRPQRDAAKEPRPFGRGAPSRNRRLTPREDQPGVVG